MCYAVAQGSIEQLQYGAIVIVHIVQLDCFVVLHQHQSAGRAGRSEVIWCMPVESIRDHQQSLLICFQLVFELVEFGLTQ